MVAYGEARVKWGIIETHNRWKWQIVVNIGFFPPYKLRSWCVGVDS